MKFYCDGSRVQCDGDYAIGWAAVCGAGRVVSDGRFGGSNINAEMLAIKSLLENLCKYRGVWVRNWAESGESVEVVTDSLTSLQIINGYLKAPQEYDLFESENYRIADEIAQYLKKLRERGVLVQWKHIRGHGRDETMTADDVLGNAFADYVATQESERVKNERK